MEIILAKKAGFCYGVNKAVDIIVGMKTKPENIFTFGALIHNPQYIEKLADEGVGVKNTVEEINEGDTIIIRSHGISDETMKRIRARGAKIIDATCPFVKNAQLIAKKMEKEGYQVIVAGDKDHAEIRGILGDLKHGLAYYNESEVTPEEIHEKVGVIAQTTISKERFDSIVAKISETAKEVKVINTICSATKEKQTEAIKLAKMVDVLIVVGGKNSSNTAQLKKVTENITKVYHIEKADELENDWFLNAKKVGVTAGASTPGYIIEEVVEKLAKF